MTCPVCKDDLLTPVALEENVPAHSCPQCHGVWLSSGRYLDWLERNGKTLPEMPCMDVPIPEWDTQGLKLCADCGRILSRYRVLPNRKFVLDHCGHCNGVWFDKDEWAIMIAHNLLGKINRFFTNEWQAQLREEETGAELDRVYAEKLGHEDYARIKDARNWLNGHPHKAMLLAFLHADNPYGL